MTLHEMFITDTTIAAALSTCITSNLSEFEHL